MSSVPMAVIQDRFASGGNDLIAPNAPSISLVWAPLLSPLCAVSFKCRQVWMIAEFYTF